MWVAARQRYGAENSRGDEKYGGEEDFAALSLGYM